MAIQKFTIKYNGKDEEIEFEDDMPFGIFESIIKKTADMSDTSKMVDNIQDYRKEILLNALKKAPFDITEEGLNSFGYKTMLKIAEKVLEAYPLGDYLSQTMKPFEDSQIMTS